MKDGRLCAAPTNARLRRRCAARKGKLYRRPAALPRVFLLQIFLYKKGNSRVASAAGVPNIHLLFSTTVLLPSTAKTGGLIIWFPPISAETTTAEKWQLIFKKIVVFWNPCAFARGFLFALRGRWSFPPLPQAFASVASRWSGLVRDIDNPKVGRRQYLY